MIKIINYFVRIYIKNEEKMMMSFKFKRKRKEKKNHFEVKILMNKKSI